MIKKKNNEQTNFIEKLSSIIESGKPKNISRPKDIPAIVPDCGWNHGEDTDNDVDHNDDADKK